MTTIHAPAPGGQNPKEKIPKKRTEQKGKTQLIQQLRGQGLSRRKATQAVNAVFNTIAAALARGEAVEVPIGTFVVTRYVEKPSTKFKRAVNVNTGKPMYNLVRRPGDRTVPRFRPAEDLDFTRQYAERQRKELEEEFIEHLSVLRGRGREPEGFLIRELCVRIPLEPLVKALRRLREQKRIMTPKEILVLVSYTLDRS